MMSQTATARQKMAMFKAWQQILQAFCLCEWQESMRKFKIQSFHTLHTLLYNVWRFRSCKFSNLQPVDHDRLNAECLTTYTSSSPYSTLFQDKKQFCCTLLTSLSLHVLLHGRVWEIKSALWQYLIPDCQWQIIYLIWANRTTGKSAEMQQNVTVSDICLQQWICFQGYCEGDGNRMCQMTWKKIFNCAHQIVWNHYFSATVSH